jgi:Putative zinc-finger
MTHLELEHLASDYLEGQLDAALRASADQHLADCEDCRAMIADVRHAMELCRTAEAPLAPPWLIPKILRATIGERKPTLAERMSGWLRVTREPRLVYSVAMVVFSFSILINAAGLNLRDLTLADLNPKTWVYQAARQGHLLAARAEKFYYDLRVVYEIESRFRQLQSQPGSQPNAAPQPATKPAGSSYRIQQDDPTLAFMESLKDGHSSTFTNGRSSSQ